MLDKSTRIIGLYYDFTPVKIDGNIKRMIRELELAIIHDAMNSLYPKVMQSMIRENKLREKESEK